MKKYIVLVILVAIAMWGIWFSVSGEMASTLPTVAGVPSSDRLDLPQETTTPAPTRTPAVPQTLRIPIIGVTASIESVGLDTNGRMKAPVSYADVAWYNLGFRPGEPGSAVIAGHLDNPNASPAVFYDLKTLKKGDEITVTDTTNQDWKFKVARVESYPYKQVPLQAIFNTKGKPTLALVTCDGVYSQVAHIYSNRTVVYAEGVTP